MRDHPVILRRLRLSCGRGMVTFLVRAVALLLISFAAAFGFRNLANYAAGLEEMRRVLKPGGTIAILEFSRVRSPVFGPLFRFYFRKMLPRIGGWISGNPDAYRYLAESVVKFPDQDALAARMRKAGFVSGRYRNFSGGVAALHTGEKL